MSNATTNPIDMTANVRAYRWGRRMIQVNHAEGTIAVISGNAAPLEGTKDLRRMLRDAPDRIGGGEWTVVR